jgi:putative SOS response-associated peptidase YedK
MCGRFRLTSPAKLVDTFGVEADEGWAPRYNIVPAQNVIVIRQDAEEPKRRGSLMRWGLIPSWAKDDSIGYKMINARAETVATKPSFRDSLKKRRCLIPADGFYEWKREGKNKTPFCFTMADDSIFAFAGLWEQWQSPAGQPIDTCSIITTSPNTLCVDVHDRMPVILPGDAYDLWLDPAFHKADAVCELLTPFDAGRMCRYQVSNRVNLVKNDDPACAEAVPA